MVEIGVALLLVGVALMVAEAHVPGGILGAVGGVALATGAALAISAAGAGAAVVGAAVLAGLVQGAVWALPGPPEARGPRGGRGAGAARVRAGGGVPARPRDQPEGTRARPADPRHRPHGPRQPAHDYAPDPAPGRDHA